MNEVRDLKPDLTAKRRALLESLLREQNTASAGGARIPRRKGDEPLPLSFAQERLWFLDQYYPGSPIYNIPAAWPLYGALDVDVVRATLNEIVRRHEALRTTFVTRDGKPLQVVSPGLTLDLAVVDLESAPEVERQQSVATLLDREGKRPFDLARGPLMRAMLIRLSEHAHYLFLTMHHIVSDAWSMQVFFAEFNAIYQAFSSGRPSPLPELAIQYPDFAVWQRQRLQGEEMEKQLAYWKQQLAGVSSAAIELPTDRPRPQHISFNGATVSFTLSSAVSDEIWKLTREAGVTPYMTLLAAFKVLLFRYTEESSVIVGSASANRNYTELEGLIGFFVNSLVLHTKLSAEENFRQVLGKIKEVVLGAQAHQELPFEKLVEELQPARELSLNPLFQVMFDFHNQPAPSPNSPAGAPVEASGASANVADAAGDVDEAQVVSSPGTGTSKFDLSMSMIYAERKFGGSIEYSTDLFDEATILRMVGHFQSLLAAAVAEPTRPVGLLPLMPAPEYRRISREWNDTFAEFPADVCVHEEFERQARLTPDRVAAVCRRTPITYFELNRRANQLANHLRGQGIGAESVVGICMHSSLEMLVAIFGVLKAGAAYLPIDPRYPHDRMAFMLQDAGARLILTQQELQTKMTALAPEALLALDAAESLLGAHDGEDLRVNVNPQNSCYVIYTSGSTGRPKGVVVEHRSLMNLLHALQLIQPLETERRVLQFASFSFDASVREVFETLLSGATLYMERRDVLIPGEPLTEFLRVNKITDVTMPPSVLAYLPVVDLPDLKTVNVGGEACPPNIVDRWATGRTFFNAYGPTETTFASSISRCYPNDGKPDIGSPLANTQYYVVDRNMQLCAVGKVGELLIGGAGLARGYMGRPDLTAERFIPDSFGQQPGGRLYRTGDLVRWLPDGKIDYLGRTDQQVKVHGFRIELGEIETALNEHPEVALAAVVCSAESEASLEKELVAYVVASVEGVTPETMQGFLASKLPEYMIPRVYVFLDTMPLTPTGKVNLKELPSPQTARRQRTYTAPRNPVEQVLVEIWEDVLGVEGVGVYDNFFALGGHSLLVTQIVSRVRDILQVELPIRKVFEFSTIADLASSMMQDPQTGALLEITAQTLAELNDLDEEEVERLLELASSGGEVGAAMQAPSDSMPARTEPAGGENPAVPNAFDRIPRRSQTSPAPLSFAQERLWFLSQFQPESTAYNIYMPLMFQGPLNLPALERSLKDLLQRHEILRTTFPVIDGHPVQLIAPEAALTLVRNDLRRVSPQERQAQAAMFLQSHLLEPFDLARGPLLRTFLINLSDTEHLLALSLHHIISDGWSRNVFYNDLMAMYHAYAKGAPSPLAQLPVQYADFAVWQRQRLQGAVLEDYLAFWRKQLAGVPPVLELPTDRPRPSTDVFRGAMETFAFPQELLAALNQLCRQENTTLFMTLLSAFMLLLHRYTHQSKITVGAPIANRNRAEIEGLIGFFTNTLVLNANIDGDLTFRQLLRQVREMTLGAYAHEDLPFEKLVEELNPERNLNVNPLFQVMFVLQRGAGIFQVPAQATEDDSEVPDEATTVAKFDLTMYVEDTDHSLLGGIEYATELFKRATIRRMINHFQMTLECLVWNPDLRLSQWSLLTPPEMQKQLLEWNPAQPVDSNFAGVVTLVEAQAARTPDAIALAYGERHLTYRQLNETANRLASRLMRLGVEPDDHVGVYTERGAKIAVALLAVLKAGGVYLPLDPEFPTERIDFILSDARPKVVISRNSPGEELRESGAHHVNFTLDAEWLTQEEAVQNPPVKISADHAAYVIYTSGSTGTPKGVVLTHRTLSDLTSWQLGESNLPPQARTAQFSSLVFDVSLQEVFATWCSGGTLECVPEEEQADFALLLDFLAAKSVERLYLPYVVLQQLAEVATERGREVRLSLREVNTAGEQLKVTPAIARWFSQMEGCTLSNHYGPSETHAATAYRLPESPLDWEQLPPIGRPASGARLYVLDGYGQPVPVGVTGELYIGGTSLARGYMNRPDLTAEKFLPDRFSAIPGARMYRTGDLVRYRPDGNLDFLGRIDQQLKIRGFRVEPGEIEISLAGHPAVAEAVVMAHHLASGERQLVAYIVPAAGASPEATELRQYLKRQLPEYMVPPHFVMLESLPLTATGKIDRRSLPAPDCSRPDLKQPFVAPRSPLEQQLAAIWQEVLGVPNPGIHDNFFDLGGYSLLATQLISRIRARLSAEISLRQFFEEPTIAGLSVVIVQSQAAAVNEEDISVLLRDLENLSDDEIEMLISKDTPNVPNASA